MTQIPWARFNFVFFSVCLTVSWEMLSTISSSTRRWAKSRNVNRLALWRLATSNSNQMCFLFAIRRCDFVFWDCRLRAASIPCSTNNLRTRSIVGMLISKLCLSLSLSAPILNISVSFQEFVHDWLCRQGICPSWSTVLEEAVLPASGWQYTSCSSESGSSWLNKVGMVNM